MHTTKPIAVLAYLQQKGSKASAPLGMGQGLQARAAGSSSDENPDQADLD